ncbi:MAG: thioredoxin domain-containing protein [Pseudomonadota bacterium]
MTRTFSMALAATAIALTPACAQGQVDTADKQAIEKIVYEYIMENPEIIEDALIALQAKRDAEEAALAMAAIADNQDALINNAADYSVGPADAPVTVVEFFDYRCGFCKRSAEWATELPEKYDNKVRVVFKEFPILSTESEKAALAAIAAGKQGKYIEMHMALMELDNGSGFGPDQIDAAAESVGVDVATMRADMKSIDVQKSVADAKSLARKLNITGTPNFIIGDEMVSGADIQQVEALIEVALADS